MLKHTFLDLGHAPPSNAYLSEKDLNSPEVHLPLKIKVCDRCWLVQTEDHTSFDKIFTKDYAYLEGYFRVKRFAKKNNLKDLFIGKIKTTDVKKLKKFIKKNRDEITTIFD